jgi:hypothetical protein
MATQLNAICNDAYLIAHQEDTTRLRQTLEQQGFTVHVVRSAYTAAQQRLATSERVLINHTRAWQAIAASGRHGVVMEADFVPVRDFGRLPLPVPADRVSSSLAYLYSVGIELWDLCDPPACMRGHAGGMVAYAVSEGVAATLLQFSAEHQRHNPSGHYSCWDADLGYWLKQRGTESYLPFRQYGEHGGIGNPEHAAAGLRATDHADALAGPLSFLPAYADGSTFRFLTTRFRARTWAWGRLLCGRTLNWYNLRRSKPLAMATFAVGRLLTPPRLQHLNLNGS